MIGDLQRDALLAPEVAERHLHQERHPARDDWSGLNACLDELRSGDVLVV